MNRRTRFIGLVLAIVLIQPFAHANGWALTLRVPEDHETIEAALGAAEYGDTVDIAVGTYYEHDLIWPPGVSIIGRGGSAESVIIDAQYQGRVMRGDDLISDNELAYITLSKGDAQGWSGSGLRVEGNPLIHDVIIEHCTNFAGNGIGLYMAGGATIEDCVLRYNQSDSEHSDGGGAYFNVPDYLHPPHIRDLEIYGNRAGYGSGIFISTRLGLFEKLHSHNNLGSGILAWNGDVDGIGPTIIDSVIEDNAGPGLIFDAAIVMRNCTIVRNSTPGAQLGGVYCASTWDHPMDSQITQCIVAFNNGPGFYWWAPTPFSIECCDVFGNKGYNYIGLPDLTGQYGNISVDPKFCDNQSEGVYGIQAGSPCAPDNNECGILMGAFPVSCEDTATENISWSRVKSLY